MRKPQLKPIDSNKLRKLINQHGSEYSVSASIGYSSQALHTVLTRGSISEAMADHIESRLGIKFDLYKPEEPKPEPKPEEPVKETVFTNRSEQCLITLVNMVGEMRNNMIVLNEKLDKLIELWGEA